MDIEKADARMEQKQPAHGRKKSRNQQSERHARVDKISPADMRAFHEPSDQHSEQQRNKYRDPGIGQSIGQDAVDEPVIEQPAVIVAVNDSAEF